MKAEKNSYRLRISEDDGEVAYLYLPKHPDPVATAPGAVYKTVRLSEFLNNYKGPDIYLDFDESGESIGIEFT